MIAIVNYGVGNLSSIKNMFKRVGVDAVISSDNAELKKATKLILPGVGAFDHCMQKFNESGLRQIITHKAIYEKVPVLGICVGLQMLTEGSEEGTQLGLGWIKGKTIRFKSERMKEHCKIPHMGWSDVAVSKDAPIAKELGDDSRFYFVHSFHLDLADKQDEFLSSNYGYPFTAGIAKDNLLGVQFHPEKSHKFGMKLFQNFIKYY